MASDLLKDITANLEYFQGDGIYQMIYYGPEDEPVDITNWAFRMKVKEKYSDTAAVFICTTENGKIDILDAELGKFAFRIPSSETQAVEINYTDFTDTKTPYKDYWYDLEAIPPGYEPFKILRGRMRLYGEVTTP